VRSWLGIEEAIAYADSIVGGSVLASVSMAVGIWATEVWCSQVEFLALLDRVSLSKFGGSSSGHVLQIS